MAQTIADRVYALIFNGITAASSESDGFNSWLPLSERNRFAEAVFAELRAGNIEFRPGPLALLAEAVEAEGPKARKSAALPADEHHFDTSCDDRPYCRIPQHHALEARP